MHVVHERRRLLRLLLAAAGGDWRVPKTGHSKLLHNCTTESSNKASSLHIFVSQWKRWRKAHAFRSAPSQFFSGVAPRCLSGQICVPTMSTPLLSEHHPENGLLAAAVACGGVSRKSASGRAALCLCAHLPHASDSASFPCLGHFTAAERAPRVYQHHQRFA